MRFVSFYILIAVLLFSSGCNNTAAYQNRKGTLDSISGAVNALAAELQRIDTISVQKQLLKFHYYQEFISRALPDTINKISADNLHRFISTGRQLNTFTANRRTILARVGLLNSQYRRLSADILNKRVSTTQLDSFLSHEIREAARLAENGRSQMQDYFKNAEEFRQLLREVEPLIRNYNNGMLPTIVRDTTTI